eukprot:gene26234-47488_t
MAPRDRENPALHTALGACAGIAGSACSSLWNPIGEPGMTASEQLVTLSGVPGSPYTRKMLAVLRYRRIPYKLILGSRDLKGLPQAKVSLLPTFYFPDATGQLQAVTDSTPIIRRLEGMFPDRSVRPANPALALIDAILEDYGD